MITRAQAEAYRNNPNVQAFLNAIAESEGTTKHGYATAFGGGKLPSLADHPRKMASFRETTGRTNKTSAAGRYQFLGNTWDEMAKGLGLTDFGPVSQDLAAIALLDRAGALQDVLNGNLQQAAKKSGSTWASLPSSPYAQPKKSQAAFDKILAKASGSTLPAMTIPAIATTPMAPPSSAGAALVPLMTKPADVVAAAFDTFPGTGKSMVPSYAAEIAALQNAPVPVSAAVEDDSDAWRQIMLRDAADDDANIARSKAVANFFGEQAAPEIRIPEAIDQSINRYLAQLS